MHFAQTIVAVVWDVDNTLIPGYMQAPLFRRFGVDEAGFWREVDALPEHYKRMGCRRVNRDGLYLHHLLAYVRAGIMPALSNRMLEELGAELTCFPGIPALLPALQQQLATDALAVAHGITVEHYAISSGLAAMVRGSVLAPHLAGIWASELIAGHPGPGWLDRAPEAAGPDAPVQAVGFTIDNTAKTRALVEISKGTDHDARLEVNAAIRPEDRRIPMTNLIYVADGPSDVPVFSYLKGQGGRCYAVYRPGDAAAFRTARSLLDQGRVHAFGPADYTAGGQTWLWLSETVRELARGIATTRDVALAGRIGTPPRG